MRLSESGAAVRFGCAFWVRVGCGWRACGSGGGLGGDHHCGERERKREKREKRSVKRVRKEARKEREKKREKREKGSVESSGADFVWGLQENIKAAREYTSGDGTARSES